MARVSSAPIKNQPRNYEIYNGFSIMGNEICLHEWTFKEGTCACAVTYNTTLTDARLLIRSETTGCCCKRDHNDVCIFLRDIAQIREATETRDCCTCCLRCCHPPKIIELRGIFGSQMLHIPEADMDSLKIGIPAAIGNHKLISHH